MAKRSKRTKRRRSIRNLFKSLRLPLLLLVFFSLVLVSLLAISQPLLLRSVLAVVLANPTLVASATTPTRAILISTPRQASTNSTPIRVEQNWKDYSSAAFSYALKYPPTMVYREWAPTADILQSVSFYLEKDSNLPLYQISEITVSIYANPQSSNTVQWLTAHTKPVEGSAALFEGVTNQQTVTVGGLEAVSFDEKSGGSSTVHRVLLARENQVFSILITDPSSASLKDTYWEMVFSIRWSTPRP